MPRHDILGETIRICRKHDIPYFVIGGTAIGALYDRAILPWDDDIDIGMARKDYNRFLEVAPPGAGRFLLSFMDRNRSAQSLLLCQSQEKQYPLCRRNVQECPDASGYFCRYIPVRQDTRQQAVAEITVRRSRFPQMLPHGKRDMDVETLRQMRDRTSHRPGSLLLLLE